MRALLIVALGTLSGCTIVTTNAPPRSTRGPAPAPAPAPAPSPAPATAPVPAPANAAPAAQSYASDYCRDSASRAQACGQTPNPPATCQHNIQCSAAVMRADAHPHMLACLSQRPCNRPDEACFLEVQKQIQPSQVAKAFTSICEHRRGACGSEVPDDLCLAGRSGGFTDAFYNGVAACLAKGCNKIRACLDQTMPQLMPAGCSPKTLW